MCAHVRVCACVYVCVCTTISTVQTWTNFSNRTKTWVEFSILEEAAWMPCPYFWSKLTNLKLKPWPGNTKGESIIVPLTSCLTGLDLSVLQIKTKIVSYHTADSKPVKQEVNGKVILLPLVFPTPTHATIRFTHVSFGAPLFRRTSKLLKQSHTKNLG
jgi:hypothetical protein